jgi:hypothetical protein
MRIISFNKSTPTAKKKRCQEPFFYFGRSWRLIVLSIWSFWAINFGQRSSLKNKKRFLTPFPCLTLRLIYETIGPSEPRLELAIANERCVTRPFGVQQHARSVVKAIELNTFDGVANIGEAASNPRLVGCGSVTHALDYTTKRSRSSVWGYYEIAASDRPRQNHGQEAEQNG